MNMGATVPFERPRGKVEIDPLSILLALPHPVIVLDAAGTPRAANPSADPFFGLSASHLIGPQLNPLISADSPVFALIEQVWDSLRREAGILPLIDAERAVIEARRAEHRSEPASAVDWATVRADLLSDQEADEQQARSAKRG